MTWHPDLLTSAATVPSTATSTASSLDRHARRTAPDPRGGPPPPAPPCRSRCVLGRRHQRPATEAIDAAHEPHRAERARPPDQPKRCCCGRDGSRAHRRKTSARVRSGVPRLIEACAVWPHSWKRDTMTGGAHARRSTGPAEKRVTTSRCDKLSRLSPGERPARPRNCARDKLSTCPARGGTSCRTAGALATPAHPFPVKRPSPCSSDRSASRRGVSAPCRAVGWHHPRRPIPAGAPHPAARAPATQRRRSNDLAPLPVPAPTRRWPPPLAPPLDRLSERAGGKAHVAALCAGTTPSPAPGTSQPSPSPTPPGNRFGAGEPKGQRDKTRSPRPHGPDPRPTRATPSHQGGDRTNGAGGHP